MNVQYVTSFRLDLLYCCQELFHTLRLELVALVDNGFRNITFWVQESDGDYLHRTVGLLRKDPGGEDHIGTHSALDGRARGVLNRFG